MLMEKLRRTLGAGIAIGSLIGAINAHALPSYSELIVFGDSLSDTGNAANFTEAAGFDLQPLYFDPAGFPGLVPATAYEVSRKFTDDGPIWVETLGATLGLPTTPFSDPAGGTVYAIGGANSTDHLPGVPAEDDPLFSVEEQVGIFLAERGGVAPSTALYTFTVGGNDIRDALTLAAMGGDPGPVIEASLFSVVDMIGALALAGAQDILLFNVPNLGLVPQVTLLDSLSPLDVAEQFSETSALYNALMAAALAQLVGDLAVAGIDLNLILADSYGLLTDVVANPALYGFDEAVDSCLYFLPEPACANPDSYVFWDGIHPTVAMHQVIAHTAFEAIPLPGPGALLLIGALAAWRARARHASA